MFMGLYMHDTIKRVLEIVSFIFIVIMTLDK